ncbi:MAG TPA: bifunctional oligoribonuclease/PAP phosphatase NrnA [Firmicutes bacterium]|nr:bifunctional oligoribonuclease/PAP phosphatase NrnA [Bacillota bacterium]
MDVNSREISELLHAHENVYILTHILPDGDAIGSALAWGTALRHHGKKVRIFCPGVVPRKYAFLPGVVAIENQFPANLPLGLVFVLDCGDLERLDYMKERVQSGLTIVNIDHHATNNYFGDYNIVDKSAAATGEMIYQLIQENNLLLSKEISLCLYVAIASDTGSFKYANTTPRVLKIASLLLENGVDPSLVSQKIFDEYPLSTVFLLRDTLNTLQLDQSLRIAWMSLHEDLLESYGAKEEELEGFVNYGKNINGVEVGIFFYHTRNGETKVGFRSKAVVDVGAVAASFGGGGHPRAAGCTIGGWENNVAMDKVIQAVREALLETETLNPEKCDLRR